MEFIDDLSVPVKFLIAFVVALAMLGIGGYLMRRIRPARTEPRLAVIDGASVGARRRLVLVQRDNVEHLLLIGGPTDVVIEPNIYRTVAAATSAAQVREPKAGPRLKTLSLEELGSPPSEPAHVEPPPAPSGPGHNAARGNGDPRAAMVRETMLHPSPMPMPMPIERQGLGTLFELTAPAPPVPPLFEPVFQIPPAPEPNRMPAPRLLQRAAQNEESNLSEMALRLQTALRRPIKPVEPV